MNDRSDRIVRIDKLVVRSTRPREVGSNARRGSHGSVIEDPVVRLHTADGAVGVGWSRLDRQAAEAILGVAIGDLFQLPDGARPAGAAAAAAAIDLPLWDLAAKREGIPLYRLLGGRGRRAVELYDSSIYIDDLQADDAEAVALFTDEVQTGLRYGYRNFKIKIGRGARWMPTAAGFERDLLVIRTVRDAAGADTKIMVDANNGGTLNSTKATLDACADVGLYWFEEPFAEDPELNADLSRHIRERGYPTLVADGESAPPESFFSMVQQGHIEVVQHDFRQLGLSWWRATAARIEAAGARCAPHCWGSIVERYTHAHFAASVANYALLEAVPAETPGLVLDCWEEQDGHLHVPDSPGIGLDLDPDVVEQGVRRPDGFRIVMDTRVAG